MGLIIHSETKLYSELIPQSRFEWDALIGSSGWNLHMNIRLNMKDEIKILFTVTPPIWMPEKDRKKLVFKTSSYRELKKWLKKHKDELKKPEEI